MQPNEPLRKIITGMGVCLVASLSAQASYQAAGWQPLDAAYMVIITLFGIGYGEVNPVVDPLLKLQTMTLIVVGCLSGLYSVGGALQLITEGEIKKALGTQKMSRGIKKMKNHIIICGYGRVGKMLAADLASKRVAVIVIDNNPSRLEEAREAGFSIVAGDATCDNVLRAAGVDRAQSLACVLPNDAINVFITLTARELNEEVEIIARAEDPRTERKLMRSGANHVILPAAIGALRMSQIISEQVDPTQSVSSGDSLPLPTSLRAIPVASEDQLAESTLQLARETMREVGDIVGIQRGNSEIMANLSDQTVLSEGDILLVSVS